MQGSQAPAGFFDFFRRDQAMFAIITAGGTPASEDPLYAYTQGKPKALLEIAGKPMVQWVLDALDGSESIQEHILIGLEAGSPVTATKPIHFLPNQAGMLENVLAGIIKLLELSPQPQQVLVTSSDIPAVTPVMVDWLVKMASETDDDLYYNVVTRETMEARYPESHRTYIHLKDMVVCGGDMNMMHTRAATSDMDFWHSVVGSRKNPLKQASLVGFDVLFLLLIRQITLQDAVRKVTKRINLKGRALACPYAEIGMDVDKPWQLEMLRRDLSAGKVG
jgi:GTP:adenosylcobinamide-phosphate guanylyltransferase